MQYGAVPELWVTADPVLLVQSIILCTSTMSSSQEYNTKRCTLFVYWTFNVLLSIWVMTVVIVDYISAVEV
jgi:uncharacterized protein with PQ loop repeat